MSCPGEDLEHESEMFTVIFLDFCAFYQLRKDDVWIVTSPKCGTTWTQVLANSDIITYLLNSRR